MSLLPTPVDKRCSLSIAAVCLVAAHLAHAQDETHTIDFAHAVVPILKQHCVECHGGHRHEGDFSINTRETLVDSGDVVPGDAAASYLIDLVASDDNDVRMPKGKSPLSEAEVKTLRAWIDAGASWDVGFSFAPNEYEPPLRPRRPGLPPATDGRDNPVDRILDKYLQQHDRPRPHALGDAAFARRAYLDAIGLLPTPEQLDAFLGNSDPEKRSRLIDSVLGNDRAYAEHWLSFWNDLLRNDYVGTGYIEGGRKGISSWLYRALLENMPFDRFARELIVPSENSEGFTYGIIWRGKVNASQKREIQFAQNVSQVFLGINMKCASCHDSFIDRWTLAETYGLAAIYSEEPLELYRCDKPTGIMATAGWMFPEIGQVDPRAPRDERLKQLAVLLTDPQDGRFTRTIVNRLWHRLMGRGIVHPVDAMQTEPWCIDLLDYLAVNLVENGYDLKYTLRQIMNSQAYQSHALVLKRESDAARFVYAGPIAKRLTAEQFVDALWQITGTAPRQPHKNVSDFLTKDEAADRKTYRSSLLASDLLMRSLGRPNREQVVSERPSSLTTLQALDLSNSEFLADTLRRGAPKILNRFDADDPYSIVTWLYKSALSRAPTDKERETSVELLGSPPTPQGVEDLVWALIMLPEFQFVR